MSAASGSRQPGFKLQRKRKLREDEGIQRDLRRDLTEYIPTELTSDKGGVSVRRGSDHHKRIFLRVSFNAIVFNYDSRAFELSLGF